MYTRPYNIHSMHNMHSLYVELYPQFWTYPSFQVLINLPHKYTSFKKSTAKNSSLSL